MIALHVRCCTWTREIRRSLGVAGLLIAPLAACSDRGVLEPTPATSAIPAAAIAHATR
jgi:hypothetical protein